MGPLAAPHLFLAFASESPAFSTMQAKMSAAIHFSKQHLAQYRIGSSWAVKFGSSLFPAQSCSHRVISGLLRAAGAEAAMLITDLCSLSMESDTPEVSTPYSILLMPAVRAQIAELTPHRLNRCALFPLVLVALSRVLRTFVHLARPDVEAVQSILAHFVHFTFPDAMRLAILSACPRALAITADLDAETSRFGLFSKMSTTKSVALAKISVTNHAGPA